MKTTLNLKYNPEIMQLRYALQQFQKWLAAQTSEEREVYFRQSIVNKPLLRLLVKLFIEILGENSNLNQN
jgi:hypothetical protein